MKTAKYLRLLATILLVSTIGGCTSNQVQNNESQPTSSDSTNTSPSAGHRFGSWVQKGTECYGLVITNQQNNRTIGKSVKCKVIAISPGKVKLKALEDVSLAPSKGCNKLGMSYGETWWETEGDIFQTREEAEKYLASKGWLTK